MHRGLFYCFKDRERVAEVAAGDEQHAQYRNNKKNNGKEKIDQGAVMKILRLGWSNRLCVIIGPHWAIRNRSKHNIPGANNEKDRITKVRNSLHKH